MTINKARIASDMYDLARNMGKAAIAGALMALPVAAVADAGLTAVTVVFATGFFGWMAYAYNVSLGMLRPSTRPDTTETPDA